MKSITVIAEDRVGLLADISYLLGKAKVNIESIGLDIVAKKAVITLTLKDPEKARSVLENAGYKVTEANIIVLKLEDQPGELSKITNMMAHDKINIENMHMLSRDGKTTILAVTVDKPKRAAKILEQYLVNKDETQI